MEERLENREVEREDRFTWKKGDVVIHKNLDEAKRYFQERGMTFIPSRSEKLRNEKEAE